MTDRPSHFESIDVILSRWIRAGFKQAFGDALTETANIGVVATANAEFGDYQCNDAMQFARVLKRSPRDIASAAADAAGEHRAVARVEVAGPGFINIFLKDEWLVGYLAAMVAGEEPIAPNVGRGRTVVLDYSSPNVAKPMHIGHIRSTVIGNAIDRLYRFLGYNVLSDNHIGDWGTQFGVLIQGYRHFLNESRLADAPVEELERLYVKSYERAREDDTWMDACRNELVKLQAGDEENVKLWKQFVSLSLEEFGRIYEMLGVRFDMMRGESYYHDQLEGVVDRLEQAGLARESEGATVVFLEEEKLPVCIVRKRDGAFNYATTDLATVATREREFAPDRVVYVTDERQQLHFKQVFTICEKLQVKTSLVHVWFGLMRLPEGVFSTRQGNVIKLEALLCEAESRALEMVKQSSPEMDEATQADVARAVGVGAVKYADLSQSPQTTVTFTWDKALALDGNSGPYLQYAHARIASVRDKYAERFPGRDPDKQPLQLEEDVERELAVRLSHFPEVVVRAAEQYRPCVLADYLYELAQAYSSFYQNVPFLKAPEGVRESRVRLCGMVAKVLSKGLDLLGIEAPRRI